MVALSKWEAGVHPCRQVAWCRVGMAFKISVHAVTEVLACRDSLLSWIALKALLSPDRPSDILSLMDGHSAQYHAIVFESNGSYVGREVQCLVCSGAISGVDCENWSTYSKQTTTAESWSDRTCHSRVLHQGRYDHCSKSPVCWLSHPGVCRPSFICEMLLSYGWFRNFQLQPGIKPGHQRPSC